MPFPSRAAVLLSALAGCTALVDLPETGKGTGGEGGSAECTVDGDCVDQGECVSISCVEQGCASTPLGAGTSCADGARECDGDGTCGGLTLGQPCTEASVCASELCVDDVCCSSACGAAATCMACDLAGFEGTCTAIPLGGDPAGECSDTACNGLGACGGELVTAASFNTETFVFGVAVNGAQQIALSGAVGSPASFGGPTVGSNISQTNYFVTSLDAELKHRWTGGNAGDQTGDQWGGPVAALGDDAWAVIGKFNGELDVNGTTLESRGDADLAVVRYSNAGVNETAVVAWVTSLGGTGEDLGTDIATDANGDVVICGGLDGAVDLGNGNEPVGAQHDMFVAKLDGDSGALLWGRRYPSASADIGYAIATFGTNIYVVGDIGGAVDFGGGTLGGAGQNDAFLLQLDADGNHMRSDALATPGIEIIFDVATDSSGAIVMSGLFGEVLEFGETTLTPVGSLADMFLLKVTADFKVVFSRAFGAVSKVQFPALIAVDERDNVVVAGAFAGNIDFGDGLVVNTTTDAGDIFVVKYAPDGQFGWGRYFGSTAGERLSALAVNDTGIVGAGTFSAPIDFGGGVLDPGAVADTFVLNLTP